MIRVQDLGEVAYGGAVTLTEWWDSKRIADGKLKDSELWKKAGFWTYLAIGLPATLMSAFGWWRRQERWMEHLSHGFMYDFPRFIFNVVMDLRAPAGTEANGGNIAVKQAKEILRRKQSELAGRAARALGQGAADVTPGMVPVTEFGEILV